MMSEVESRTYKAFLSHEGSDKRGVVSFFRDKLDLYGKLSHVFYDDDQRRGGTLDDTIKPQLRKALGNSEWFIALITPKYLSHYWCMWELKEFVGLMDQDSKKNRTGPRKKILPVFYGVSARDCKNKVLLEKYFKAPDGPVSKGMSCKDLCKVMDKTLGILGVNAAQEDRKLTDAEVVHKVLKDIFDIDNRCPPNLKNSVEEVSDPSVDRFVRVWNVQRNEGHRLVFDVSASSSAPEAKLKRRILSQADTDVIAAVDSSAETAVPAQGFGGVGKTCALIHMGYDRDIRARFTDGVHFLSFGKDADDAKFISSLASIVRRAGGRTVAKSIAACSNVREALDECADWFSGKTCLFLADDIWEQDGRGDSFIYNLKRMVQCSQRSVLVISTRSQSIARQVNIEAVVNFAPRRWDSRESKEMLCASAGFTFEELEHTGGEPLQYFLLVLEKCGGLPLALSMCGTAVRDWTRMLDQSAKHKAWIVYCNRTFPSSDISVVGMLANSQVFTAHPGLQYIFDGSLRQLQDKQGQQLVDSGHSMNHFYYSLAVLLKQQLMPVCALRRLWCLSTDEEAEKIARMMEDLDLLKISFPQDSESSLGVSLHDIQLDFCTLMAEQENILGTAHSTLLSGYLQRRDDRTVREWWSDELQDDGYLHRNLARHLVQSGAVDELEKLLLDFRWTRRQCRVNGFALMSDFAMIEKELERQQSQNSTESVQAVRDRVFAMSMISGAYFLSWTYASKNDYELPMHMYGRLFWMRDENEWIDSYVHSVDQHTTTPWLRTIFRCLQSPGGQMQARWNVRRVFSVTPICDSMSVVVGGIGGRLQVIDCENGAHLQQFEGHTDFVRSVDVSSDGRFVVSGSNDKTIRVWDVTSGAMINMAEMQSVVLSVSLSDDGRKVAFGCHDGSVGVRRVPNVCEVVCDMRRRVESRRRRRFWKCLSEHCEEVWENAHTGTVNAVAMSGDGHIVVSGSRDGDVRIWCAETGAAIGSALCGHTDIVRSVVINTDGSRVVSGGEDGVWIWDAERSVALAGPLSGSEGAWSVAVNPDWSLIAVGIDNGEIKVYDVDTWDMVGEPLSGHTTFVWSVAFCCNGSRIVSGSDDDTVRLWKLEDADDASQSIVAGRDPRQVPCVVDSVALSPDNATVAVVIYGGDIWLYDADTCEPVGQPIQTYEELVLALAFSDDGQFLAACHRYVMVIDMDSRSIIKQLEAGEVDDCDWIYCVAFSADGAHVAAAYDENYILVWNISDGRVVSRIPYDEDRALSSIQLRALAFSHYQDQNGHEPDSINDPDDVIYADDSGFYLNDNVDAGPLAFVDTVRSRSDWSFDNSRGRLWACNPEGGLFVANLVCPPPLP